MMRPEPLSTAARQRHLPLVLSYLLLGAMITYCYLGIWPELVRDSTMRLIWCKRQLALLFLFALAVPAIAHFFSRGSLADKADASPPVRSLRTAYLLGIMAITSVLSLGVSFCVLDAFPNSGDEYAYIFQAELFQQGRTWAQAPPLGDAFVPFRTWVFDGKWASQYPPGWPAILAIFGIFRIPGAAVNSILAAGLVAITATLTKQLTGSRLASALSVPILVLNGFFIFNAASLHSHVSASVLLALLVLYLARLQRAFTIRGAIFAGMAFSITFSTRYYVAVALMPCIMFWIAQSPKRTAIRTLGFGAIGAAPVFLLMCWYQYGLTGSPFKTTYAIISVPESMPGISASTVTHGLMLTGYRLVELATWTSPLHLIAPGMALALNLMRRRVHFADLAFPGFVFAYVLFPDLGGNRYGPRYYFDAFPVCVASTVSAFATNWPWIRNTLGAHRARRIVSHAAVAACLFGTLAALTAIPAYRSQVFMRQEPFRLAAEIAHSKAVVIVEKTMKNGLIPEDYARNSPRLDADVLFARTGTAVAAVRQAFGDREIFIYERSSLESPARFVEEGMSQTVKRDRAKDEHQPD